MMGKPRKMTAGRRNFFNNLINEEGMIDRFQSAAEAVGAVVRCFSTRADAVEYVRREAGASVAASELPEDIRQTLGPLSFATPDQYHEIRTGISFAEAGIAETGSLLLELTDPRERSATTLPPVHMVFLRASSIVADLQALSETLKNILDSRPQSYLSLITGPSRTADIERVLTIGVHGPKELQILILEGE